MITKNGCYGCMLCSYRCPTEAIRFAEDECGFSYPQIDQNKCIDCGLCERICIANDPPEPARSIVEAYSCSLVNRDILRQSASGGAAYGLSMAQLDNNGIVYGCAYSKDFHAAEYVRVESKEELSRLQDTKYFHATATSKKQLFADVERDLMSQNSVLVIGLPCEIAALKKLAATKQNLTLVELFCHGVTTHQTHERYLRSKGGLVGISDFTVKGKLDGWQKDSYIQLKTDDGKVLREPFYSSAYGYAFSHLSRSSCYCCHFKGDARVGDISIGDYWGILQKGNAYNKDGVSVVQVHTDRGKALFEACSKYMQIAVIDAADALTDNAWVEKTIPNDGRSEYAKRFAVEEDIYVPLQVRLKKLIKAIVGCQ